MGLFANSKLNRVSEYISDCYSRLDPKIRDSVFSGGEKQVTTVFESMAVMRGDNTSIEDSTKEDVAKLLSIYIYIVLSSETNISRDDVVAYLCSKYGQYVTDEQHGKVMYSFALMNHKFPDFSALDKNNISLIINDAKTDGLRKTRTADFSSRPSTRNTGSKEEEESIGYYFANKEEFIIYVKAEKPEKKILWLSGDNYINEFQLGYSLVDRNDLNSAVEHFNKAISWNPVAIDARFELINCYYGLKRIDEAIGSLKYMEKYLARKKDVAHYYRAFGYFFVENRDYKRGAAAYRLSLDYDNNAIALGELAGIINTYQVDLSNENIKGLVQSGGAALLSPWYDEIEKETVKENDQEEISNDTGVLSDTDKQLICSNCHSVLPKDSEFCQYCGAAVKRIADIPLVSTNEVSAGQTAHSSPENNPVISKSIRKSHINNSTGADHLRSQNRILLVIVGVLAAITVVLAGSILKTGKEKNTTIESTAEVVINENKGDTEIIKKEYSVPKDVKAGAYKIRLASKADSDYARIKIYNGAEISEEVLLVNSYSYISEEEKKSSNIYIVKYITLTNGNVVVIDEGTSDIEFEKR